MIKHRFPFPTHGLSYSKEIESLTMKICHMLKQTILAKKIFDCLMNRFQIQTVSLDIGNDVVLDKEVIDAMDDKAAVALAQTLKDQMTVIMVKKDDGSYTRTYGVLIYKIPGAEQSPLELV